MSQISNANTKSLNQIQSFVYNTLKNEGFKKSGRAFNKKIDEGIIHVINFQIGQRDLEGYFTINLGVYVEELDEVKSNSKKIFHEYDCHIRVRLNELTTEFSDWVKADKKIENISKLIIKLLMNEGASWFSLFNSKNKIVENLQKPTIGNFKNSNRSRLDAAILQLSHDKKDAQKIFIDYYKNITDNIIHKNYVGSLAEKFDLKINDRPDDESLNIIKDLLGE